MNLFFDFTGSHEPDYPAGQPTLGQMLTQAVAAKEPPGPLVLVVGSDIYVYEPTSGARLGQQQFRADRASGFYELTAIRHIGPALARLAACDGAGEQPCRQQCLIGPDRRDQLAGAVPEGGIRFQPAR